MTAHTAQIILWFAIALVVLLAGVKIFTRVILPWLVVIAPFLAAWLIVTFDYVYLILIWRRK